MLVAGIGGALATSVSFGMAVYKAANPEPLKQVAAHTPIETGRWRVTLEKARATATPPTGIKPVTPKTFVTVELELENRTAATSNVLRLLTLDPPVPDLPVPVFYLARDNWIAGGLHPGMPERIIAAWEWPQAQPLPERLRLLVRGQTFKRRDNLYGASNWFDGDPVAAVELPVAQDADLAAPRPPP